MKKYWSKHNKTELKNMINYHFGCSHKGEKIIDIYSFMSETTPIETIKVIFLSPDTHTVYKETYSYNHSTHYVQFLKVDGIL